MKQLMIAYDSLTDLVGEMRSADYRHPLTDRLEGLMNERRLLFLKLRKITETKTK